MKTKIPRAFIGELKDAIAPLQPVKAGLFGSSPILGLGGKDIDLLVFSDSFKKYFWQDRSHLLKLPSGYNFDLWLFTPAEYRAFFPQGSEIRKKIEKNFSSLLVNRT